MNLNRVISDLGKLEKSSEILLRISQEKSSFPPLEQQRKRSIKRRKNFLSQNNYRVGLRIKDCYTGVEGVIKRITDSAELVISHGSRDIQINPLNTKLV